MCAVCGYQGSGLITLGAGATLGSGATFGSEAAFGSEAEKFDGIGGMMGWNDLEGCVWVGMFK